MLDHIIAKMAYRAATLRIEAWEAEVAKATRATKGDIQGPLDLSIAALETVPPIPAKLRHLYMTGTQVTYIEALPACLETAVLTKNIRLESIGPYPVALRFLDVSQCNVRWLRPAPPKLERLHVFGAPLSRPQASIEETTGDGLKAFLAALYDAQETAPVSLCLEELLEMVDSA